LLDPPLQSNAAEIQYLKYPLLYIITDCVLGEKRLTFYTPDLATGLSVWHDRFVRRESCRTGIALTP
jgi:hypothetical protein